MIIGCDFHLRFQQVAYMETDMGEYAERRRMHGAEAESFIGPWRARGREWGWRRPRTLVALVAPGADAPADRKPELDAVGRNEGRVGSRRWTDRRRREVEALVPSQAEYMVDGTRKVAIEGDGDSTCESGSFSHAKRFPTMERSAEKTSELRSQADSESGWDDGKGQDERHETAPPRQKRAFHDAVLDEIIEERAVSSRNRRNPRGVKRKMGNFPLRPRQTEPRPRIDIAKAIRIIK